MAVDPGREYNYGRGVTVHFGHMDNQPVMFVRRQIGNWQDSNPSYPIFLDDAHKYRQDHPEAEFQAHKVALYLLLTESLEIRSMTDKATMAFIGGIIENHLDDLLQMPPSPVKSFKQTLEHAVEHYGLTAKVNGEIVLGG